LDEKKIFKHKVFIVIIFGEKSMAKATSLHRHIL